MAKRRKRQWKTQDSSSKQTDDSNPVLGKSNPAQGVPSCQTASSRRMESSSALPRWTPWMVTLVTFAIRVHHVIDPKNWWVLHPDEIYQSMEVAHSELYGYGHRPYEFIPPPKGDNLSHYQQRELNVGMNALRSPILPQYMVLVTWLAHTAGLDVSNPYLVFRISHVAITSLLPLAVFKFAEAACGCPDVASVAAVLTGTSAYLSTLGSHTLINSFVSPAIFLGLAQALRVLQSNQKNSEWSLCQRNKTVNCVSPKRNQIRRNFFKLINDVKHEQSERYRSFHGYDRKEVDLAGTDYEIYLDKHTGETKAGNLVHKLSSMSDHKKEEKVVVTENSEESISGQFSEKEKCYPLYQSTLEDQGYVSRASRTSSSSSNGSTSTIDDDSGNETDSTENCHGTDNENIRFYRPESPEEAKNRLLILVSNIICGTMLSVAMYIRPDSALLVGCVLLGNHTPSRTISLLQSWPARQFALGGVVGLVLAAIDDAIFYDCFVLSPLNWARMNVFNGMASKLFGVSSWDFYIRRVFLRDFSMCVASFMFIIAAISIIYQFVCFSSRGSAKSKYINGNDADNTKTNSWLCKNLVCTNERCSETKSRSIFNNKGLKIHVVCVVALTVIYSCMGHKEERFLHDTVVIFLIAVAQIMLDFVNILMFQKFKIGQNNRENLIHHSGATDQSSKPSERQLKSTFLILVFLSLFVVYQVQIFTSPFDVQRKHWHKSSKPSDLDTTMCMHFLSHQADVSGIFVDKNIKDTGGYSVLHKNVPLFYLLGQDFIEFTNASLVMEKRSCVIGSLDGTGNNLTRRKSNRTGAKTSNRSREKSYDSEKGVNIDNLNTDDPKVFRLENNIDDTHASGKRNPCEVGYFSINMVSDLVHKENTVGILRKIVGVSTTAQPNNNPTNKHRFHPPPQPRSRQQTQQQQSPHDQRQQQQQQQHKPREAPHYNYAIVQGDKPFLSPAFRPVYRAGTMWVWRRVGTPQTEAKLRAVFLHVQAQTLLAETRRTQKNVRKNSKLQNSTHKPNVTEHENIRSVSGGPNIYHKANASDSSNNSYSDHNNSSKSNMDDNDSIPTSLKVMEYEGETLKQLGNYWAALNRFQTIASISKDQNPNSKVAVSVLASMAYCFHRIGEQHKMQNILDECMTLHPRDQCLDGWRARVPKLV